MVAGFEEAMRGRTIQHFLSFKLKGVFQNPNFPDFPHHHWYSEKLIIFKPDLLISHEIIE